MTSLNYNDVEQEYIKNEILHKEAEQLRIKR